MRILFSLLILGTFGQYDDYEATFDGLERARKTQSERDAAKAERKQKNKNKKNRRTTPIPTTTTTTSTTTTTTTSTTTTTATTTTTTTTLKPTTKATTRATTKPTARPTTKQVTKPAKVDRQVPVTQATSGDQSGVQKYSWIPDINKCWECTAASIDNTTDVVAMCKSAGVLKTCNKNDVCMVESRLRNDVTYQVLMGCKQETACLTQRGNNNYDCQMSGDVQTCRQCCNGFNCAAKSYFSRSQESHQSRSLGSDSATSSLSGQWWFQDMMLDPK